MLHLAKFTDVVKEFLLIVHILAAAAWIGGSLFAGVSFAGMASNLGLKSIKSLDESIGTRYFGTAVGLLLLSGIGLVFSSDQFGWGDAFVLIGIGVVVVDGILEGVIFGPRLKKLAESETEDLLTFRKLFSVSTVSHLALFTIAVWAMVVKIGT